MKNFFKNIRNHLHDPKFTTQFHKWATIFWIIMIVPSIFWWSDVLLWVVLMSVWANIGSHWSAYQASRSEQKQDENSN